MEHQKTVVKDVTVGTVERILGGKGGVLFSGGPRWPDFDNQLEARTCRGRQPHPVDSAPESCAAADSKIDHAIWCGPLVHHFGHQIADFGMRIAASAHLDSRSPLLFSNRVRDNKPAEVASFFLQILSHLKVDPSRILFVNAPIHVSELGYFAQAERLHGVAPSSRHLDLLDQITGSYAEEKDISAVYVSRSRYIVGGIAGEAYLDQVFRDMGIVVVHPELLPLELQMNIYKRSKKIIFSEGSALHGLQLLGRIKSDIFIVSRRPRSKMCATPIKARAHSLNYFDAVRHNIYGLGKTGAIQASKGCASLDPVQLHDQISQFFPTFSNFWDEEQFIKAKRADIAKWFSMVNGPGEHKDQLATTQAAMVEAGFEGIAAQLSSR